RDQNESRRGADATRCERAANRANEPASTRTKKPSSPGPNADWVKEWTEAIVPERGRKVPSMARTTAGMTSTKVHAWTIPRRCRTRDEWMNAVATSHGMSDAFSTGSHAQ